MINYDNRVKWQIDCDYAIKEKNNVILSSPTGSGKTKRYEIWALNKSERPIFITSPIKALSNQKFRKLQSEGFNVGLETGDIKYIPDENCDIICCTQEIYNNKYRDYENCTLIIDEFSYIFDDEDRARSYIDSLYHSEAKNIMICSATFGNPEEIRQYINKVTGRDFFLYKNKERLTALEYKGQIKKEDIKNSLVVCYSSRSCKKIATSIYNNRISKIKETLRIKQYDDLPFEKITKKEVLELAKKYQIDNEILIKLCNAGIAYYYGSLYPKEKLFIEELFEEQLIDVLVGTDALALGVNFPIQNVVFAQLKKKMPQNEIISKNLFEQLSGRAGRKGFYNNGYVYYCDDFQKEMDKFSRNESLEKAFFKLINTKNESVHVSLLPNIRDILKGKKTIEEEARFIVEYSTITKNYDTEKANIEEIINRIKTFDLAFYYLTKKFHNLKFDEGYEKAIEDCTQKFKRRFNNLSNDLMLLQPHFDQDIANVYLYEYSLETNFSIFTDVLMQRPIETLIENYGKDLRNILLLRKYINQLPAKYAKQYDISVLDRVIDTIDFTVLHPENLKQQAQNDGLKDNAIVAYPCPNYFERISIDGKEYIKLFIDDGKMLVCNYSEKGMLKLSSFPLTVSYKLLGYIKLEKRLEILNRIDFSMLSNDIDNTANKIEGMKLSLSKTRKYRMK